MTGAPAGRGAGGSRRWATRDLLVVAAVGVALGLALVPVIYGAALLVSLEPVGPNLIIGLFAVPSLVAAYVTRRPGAALLCSLFVGLAQLPFNPFGWVGVLLQLIPGLGCELVFLATRYRRFGLPTMLGAGTAAALLGLAAKYVPLGYGNLAFTTQLAIVVVLIASGAVLGGLLAKLLADALARTGVLSGYAIGRERREEV